MKTILITAPTSNTGKTTLTLGLLRALKNKGLNVSSYKTGPDYIDTKYHELACGNSCSNLDMHMMKEEGLKEAFYLNSNDYSIVEGAMGYFDGIYNTYKNSSYDISDTLDIPSILVYEAKGEMFSAIPKIRGMVDFSNGRIKGIIINKASEHIYNMLKEAIEKYVGIEVIGYVPKYEEFVIPSRYLGLYQPSENKDLDKKIDFISEKIQETVDLNKFISLMEEKEMVEYKKPKKRNIKVAIAYDEAFNFYYTENIRYLEESCQVEYFSPIKDKELPDADLIYIGGGYPELYKKELSENISLKNSIKSFSENNGYIFAEGGGLMYLSKFIDEYEMCNVIDGKSIMTERTQRFGYTYMKLKKDTILGKKGIIIHGKEFHRSKIESKLDNIFEITKPMNSKNWECGYEYKNVIASYGHISFLGNKEVVENLLNNIEEKGRVVCI